MAQKQAHLASSMHPASFYRGNVESSKDATNIVNLDLSNIPSNLSIKDLERHLANFKIIELEATHDVTTGKHNNKAQLKVRIKNADEGNLYNKLHDIKINYENTKVRATGKRDNL